MMLKTNKINFNVQYVFFLLFGVQTSLINTPLELRGRVSSIYFLVELIFFFFCLIQIKVSLKKLISIIFLMSYGIFTYIYLKETIMFLIIMATIIASFMDWSSLLKYIYIIRLIGLITVISLSLTGLIDKYSIFVSKGTKGKIVHGYGLGYTHPNKLAFAVGTLIFIWVLYKNCEIHKTNLVGMGCLIGLFFEITQSRSLLFIGLFLIGYLYLSITHKKIVVLFNKIGIFIMPLCAIFSLGIPYAFSRASGHLLIILSSLNDLLSGRFTHSANIFSNTPIPLLGGVFNLSDYQSPFLYTTIDNGYQNFLYEFGIVGLIFFLIMYYLSAKKFLKYQTNNCIIIIVCFALWGVSENILRSPIFILTPVLWSILLRSRNAIEE